MPLLLLSSFDGSAAAARFLHRVGPGGGGRIQVSLQCGSRAIEQSGHRVIESLKGLRRVFNDSAQKAETLKT